MISHEVGTHIIIQPDDLKSSPHLYALFERDPESILKITEG